MTQLVWLIPLLPLLSFAIIGLLNKRLPKSIVTILSCGSVLGSFIISVGIFMQVLKGGDATTYTYTYFEWLKAGNLNISMAFMIDPLSSLMLLIVTGVGFLIHMYSTGYMSHDEGYNRFFAYLNLFIVFMLLLVLGANYAVMFAGWEGVGLCSYLLIGFWFKNNDYNNAAKKAFIMNRIGDLGFLLGMFLIYTTFGSLNYSDVFTKAAALNTGTTTITIITLLLFVGAIGKSAQLPLYTWLPDAMAGPTPVSALIHAATMVTAGIYMVARSNILYALSPSTLMVIAIVGALTAIFAATIGLTQNDIKKVLAYSTVSQLGYMFVALGVGSFTSAMFHVTTHAFFKALLFLGAGSVIHAMSGEQDIRKMGGLRKALPVTYLTFLIATLAISGVPPFAGFFSKDEILTKVYEHSFVLYLILSITSIFTAFYMFRLFYLTFFGQFRGTEEQKHHLHESPKSITIPLIALAVLSAIGGFMGIPKLFGGNHALESFLKPVFAASTGKLEIVELSHSTEYVLLAITLVILSLVIMAARNQYMKMEMIPAAEGEKLSPLHKLVYNKYYIDELYDNIIVKPLLWISIKIEQLLEIKTIDNFVNSTGRVVQWGSSTLRYVQTGSIGFYIFAMVVGVIAIIVSTCIFN